MYDREDSIGYLINQASRLNQKALRHRLAAGIQPSYLPVIRCLTERDGQTQSELCVRIGIEQPSMAEIIKRMEKDGLVARKAHEADGRRQRLFLTAKIKHLTAGLMTSMEAVNAMIQREIPESELQQIKQTLRRIIANIESSLAETVED